MSERLGTLIVSGGSRGSEAAVSRMAAARGYAVTVNYQRDEVAANAVVRGIRPEGGSAAAIEATWLSNKMYCGFLRPPRRRWVRFAPW